MKNYVDHDNYFLAHDIPYDSQYIDIDYMDRALDFTLGSNFSDLPRFTSDLHQKWMKLVLIFDPAICSEPYQDKNKPYPAWDQAQFKMPFQ